MPFSTTFYLSYLLGNRSKLQRMFLCLLVNSIKPPMPCISPSKLSMFQNTQRTSVDLFPFHYYTARIALHFPEARLSLLVYLSLQSYHGGATIRMPPLYMVLDHCAASAAACSLKSAAMNYLAADTVYPAADEAADLVGSDSVRHYSFTSAHIGINN
ncbi:Uncharacterized protein TCM_020976 [Theobroma cacao]|uniref:Uncharacterized protein n=1 Tax=Theobroma cacao TaxID=3641 RepID=A0A061ENG3_THECC|nr:Uncharacterized protein TCM_020976 [Theobroma cacao]